MQGRRLSTSQMSQMSQMSHAAGENEEWGLARKP